MAQRWQWGSHVTDKKVLVIPFKTCANVDSYFPSDTIIYELLSDESERIKDTTQEHLDVRKYISFSIIFSSLVFDKFNKHEVIFSFYREGVCM